LEQDETINWKGVKEKMRIKGEPEEEPKMQMSPMIDIIFQLIIFFMVVSTFQRLEVEELKLPVASHSKEKEVVPGELTVNIKKDGTIIVNQRKYTPEELGNLLRETLRNNPNLALYWGVNIRADAAVPCRYVLKVIKACSEAGVWKTSFSSVQSEE
jgi:biopolymer transport protein ExbD